MSCTHCTQSRVLPWHGFQANCRGCAARAAARSPHYARVKANGMQDRHYRALLEKFGLSHEEVKAAAADDFEGRVAA